MGHKWKMLKVAAGSLVIMGIFAPIFGLNPPPVSSLKFSEDTSGQVVVENEAEIGAIQAARVAGGEVVADAGKKSAAWLLDQDLAFGVGRLEVDLNRDAILSDLALVVDAEISDNSDLTFQLFDAAGEGLAMDLFGAFEANATAVGTDTFILPLSRYPTATTLVVRRLSGPLTIRELLMIPVLSAFDNPQEFEREMAALLGETLVRTNASAEQKERVVLGRIHTIPALETINKIGASALASAGYPDYVPMKTKSEKALFVPTSGTVYDFAKRANRLLALESGEPCELFFTSSSVVHRFFPGTSGRSPHGQPNRAELGLASVPLSPDKKAEFKASYGHPAIEIPIARSAIEVLVHRENPIASLTDWQLSAAFSEVGKAETWADLGVEIEGWATRTVAPYGGHASWGTSRVFRNLALKGNPWRGDLAGPHDVVYPWGVERMVGENPGAIGYAVQRSREYPVKAVKPKKMS